MCHNQFTSLHGTGKKKASQSTSLKYFYRNHSQSAQNEGVCQRFCLPL